MGTLNLMMEIQLLQVTLAVEMFILSNKMITVDMYRMIIKVQGTTILIMSIMDICIEKEDREEMVIHHLTEV